MRLKPLVSEIIKSQAYQQTATPEPSNSDDESNFSHAVVKLLPAEVLLDALSDVLGVPERFRAPKACATQLPGPVQGSASSNPSASPTGS